MSTPEKWAPSSRDPFEIESRPSMASPRPAGPTFDVADLGSRAYAYLIDLFIRICLFLGCLLAVVILRMDSLNLSLFGAVLTAIAFLGLQFAYMIVFEALWNGQTPGKRFVGLRVVRDGGYPVGVLSVTIRNLMRIVDILPLCYGIGAPLVFLTSRHKRLGDFVAGTVVVRETSHDLTAYAGSRASNRAAEGAFPPEVVSPWVGLLPALTPDLEGLELVRSFLGRKATLQPPNRIRLRSKILKTLLSRQPNREAAAAVDAAVPPNQIELFLEALMLKWT